MASDSNRYEYSKALLQEADLLADPFSQLDAWLKQAIEAMVIEPYAMCLSTVGSEGRPSSRMVLLRGLDHLGLRFYTNYESRKGLEIQGNPFGAANFWWGALERQVRVEGVISKLPPAESDAYFASRPRSSRLASAVSPQSKPITRTELEKKMEDLAMQHPTEVPRPNNWGGYLLTPDRFEFWQGRPARLHDRFLYTREGEEWCIERLAP